MRTFRLTPVRHVAPECLSYDDLAAVARYEREMRVHRAYSETYVVEPLEDRVDGAFAVRGGSGSAYVVDVVDGSRRHDSCTCPDFLFNQLGTCKHIEAVRRALMTDASARREYERLARTPVEPTVAVDAEDGLDLVACGRWPEGTLKRLGLVRDVESAALDVAVHGLLRAGRQEGVRVVHAVPSAVELIVERRRRTRRADAFRTAFREGRLGVEVLSLPLFPYQRDGVAHLAGQGRALLADDMGLGKTVQAIAACEVLRARGEAARIVVVTPASLKHQWAREVEKYTGCRAAVVGGGAVGRAEAFRSDAPYKVLSYELTWRELPRLRDLDADVLILDEAQRARNFRTKTAATLRSIPSRFLFVLTGTPVENRLDDLYALLQLVDPCVLGPLWRFNFDFHKQGPRGKVLGCKNLGALRERTAAVVLRRRKDEVLSQLPPLVEQTRYCPLTREQSDVDASMRFAATKYMKIAEKRPLTPLEQQRLMAALLKARQACNALELYDPTSPIKASPKLEEFEAVVAEIVGQGTGKVLVFSEWVEMLKLAAERLDRAGIGWAMLHGGVAAEKRPALLDRFRQDSELRVLLSTDAGGVGLNLQVANYVVHLDLPWNPARLDQRTSRAHRLGQTRGVTAIYLCSETGIERGIEATLAGKRAVRSAALDQGSTTEEVEGQSFSVFLRQLQKVMAALDGGADGEAPAAASSGRAEAPEAPVVEAVEVEPSQGVAAAEAAPAARDLPEAAQAAPAMPVPSHPAPPVLAPASATPAPATPGVAVPAGPTRAAAAPRKGRSRSAERLRLARVVLEAGFPADAIRASYDALAAAVTGLSEAAAPASHMDLIVLLYKELLPSGRVPAALPAVLARLHDLDGLVSAGVDPDPDLASQAVAEVETWVARLTGAGDTTASTDAATAGC